VLKAVVFDRDGVLADFDLERAHAELGAILPFGLSELRSRLGAFAARVAPPTHGASEPAFFNRFAEELGNELGFDDERRAKLARFDPRATLAVYPDARGALERARACGLRIGVLSNFTLLDLRGSLEAIGVLHLVDAALSAADIGAAKPAAAAYQAIAAALDVDPRLCLFIDDRPEHVAGASRAGMRAVLLKRGAGGADEGVIGGLDEIDSYIGAGISTVIASGQAPPSAGPSGSPPRSRAPRGVQTIDR
jgi:putative hydrolase of the HAD superfamily